MTKDSTGRRLVVTIDTEVDKDARWHVSSPISFRSVRQGIPELLTPLFNEFGVVPTYLLSGEVIEDDESVSVLRGLESAELGTHLHGDFVDPGRRLYPSNMAGDPAEAVQCEYTADVEFAKLDSLTSSFQAAFGYRPTAFRAGRFGLGPNTLESLARLGYRVDSSVTPGLVWRYPQATIDFRAWSTAPAPIVTPAGPLLELPVGVLAGGRLANLADRSPAPVGRLIRGVFRNRGRHRWLRPSWGGRTNLLRYVEESPDRVLVLMFHSMEIVPGASPYAATEQEVTRILAALRTLFAHCADSGIGFCGLSEAARLA